MSVNLVIKYKGNYIKCKFQLYILAIKCEVALTQI